MTSLTLATGIPEAAALGAHPRVVLVGESGRRFTLTAAPPLSRSGLAPRYDTLQRVARKPMLTRGGYELKAYEVEMIVAGRDGAGRLDDQAPVEAELAVLREMAASGERVRWEGYGPSETGWFRLTSLSERDLRRRHGTNELTQVQVTMTLTEAVEGLAHVGPVTGGVQPPAAAPAPAAAPGAPAPAPGPGAAVSAPGRTYTVASGDTFAGISAKMYGRTDQWRKIADANGVSDPRKLVVGKVLTIP